MEVLLFALFFIFVLIFFIAGKDDFGRKEIKSKTLEKVSSESKNEPKADITKEQDPAPIPEAKQEPETTPKAEVEKEPNPAPNPEVKQEQETTPKAEVKNESESETTN